MIDMYNMNVIYRVCEQLKNMPFIF